MHSISKTAVSLATARRLIAAAFGPQAAIADFQELTDGFFNAAYLVALGDGERYVLKVAPPRHVRVLRYERNIIHAEVAAIELVARETNVPVPAIYRFDDSGELLDVPYFIMEFLPGVPLHKARPDLAPAEQEQIDEDIGRYLRQINELAGPAFGYLAPGASQHDSWRAAFLQILDDVLADGEAIGVALPRPSAQLREQIGRAAAALDEVAAPRLVHWDLWDGNIFFDPETRQITGIIDFERALWADPLMEFQFRSLEEPAGFRQGYERPMLDSPSKRARRVLYSLHLYLIMVIECAYRQFATNDQETWAREQLDQELVRLDALLAGDQV